jgi:hypothetical protein
MTASSTGVTAAQRKWLLRTDVRGLISCTSNNGLMKKNWHVMMNNLAIKGYVRPYPLGGYELTDLGRIYVAAERRYEGR